MIPRQLTARTLDLACLKACLEMLRKDNDNQIYGDHEGPV
jgi:hypothetical protein